MSQIGTLEFLGVSAALLATGVRLDALFLRYHRTEQCIRGLAWLSWTTRSLALHLRDVLRSYLPGRSMPLVPVDTAAREEALARREAAAIMLTFTAIILSLLR